MREPRSCQEHMDPALASFAHMTLSDFLDGPAAEAEVHQTVSSPSQEQLPKPVVDIQPVLRTHQSNNELPAIRRLSSNNTALVGWTNTSNTAQGPCSAAECRSGLSPAKPSTGRLSWAESCLASEVHRTSNASGQLAEFECAPWSPKLSALKAVAASWKRQDNSLASIQDTNHPPVRSSRPIRRMSRSQLVGDVALHCQSHCTGTDGSDKELHAAPRSPTLVAAAHHGVSPANSITHRRSEDRQRVSTGAHLPDIHNGTSRTKRPPRPQASWSDYTTGVLTEVLIDFTGQRATRTSHARSSLEMSYAGDAAQRVSMSNIRHHSFSSPSPGPMSAPSSPPIWYTHGPGPHLAPMSPTPPQSQKSLQLHRHIRGFSPMPATPQPDLHTPEQLPEYEDGPYEDLMATLA